MASPKTAEVSLLLEVFREGLILGVITKQEVVGWADDIINKSDDVDYLFIELSLSKDINALIAAIDEYVISTDNPICQRVLLGCIYKKMPKGKEVANVEEIARRVGNVRTWDSELTAFEVNKIYEFDDYEVIFLPDLKHLQVVLSGFLAIYEPFNLQNYKEWEEINLCSVQLNGSL